MGQHYWDEITTIRWPEIPDAVIQNGTVGVEEPGAVADTQQVTQTPMRDQAAPSSLGQRHPPPAKPPPPVDSVGTLI